MDREEYKFVAEKDFRKMTKSQKLEMPIFEDSMIEISKLLLIPISRKMDGYGMGAFFIDTTKGWARLHDYDCWRINADDPIKIEHNLVRGDFEYGGVVIFGFAKEEKDIKIVAESYGGGIVLIKK